MANRMLGVKPATNCKWCGKKLGVFVVRGKYCSFSCMVSEKEYRLKNNS